VKSTKTRALTIGLVPRRAGVGVETVRFYERQGLIEEPPRRLSGYREYDEEVVRFRTATRRAGRGSCLINPSCVGQFDLPRNGTGGW